MNDIERRLNRLEAYEKIRALEARHQRALDEHDQDTIVSLFTIDGEVTGPDGARVRVGGRRLFADSAGHGPDTVHHQTSQLEIELAEPEPGHPPSARTRSQLRLVSLQDGVSHIATGHCEAFLVHTGEKWLFRHRETVLDVVTPVADGRRVPILETYDHPPIELGHRIDGPPGAPVLVLGPALGTDLHLFDAQVAELAGRFRILRFDLPGHGTGPAPPGPYTVAGLARDVADLLDRHDVRQAHYAGVSLGGAVGQQLAVDHPDRILSLTVIASATRFGPRSSWQARKAEVRAKGTSGLITECADTWFTRTFVERHNKEAVRLLTMLKITSDEGYIGCCDAIAAFDLRRRLPEVGVPVLAIAGANDRATPPEALRRVADLVQDGRLVAIEGAAHLVNIDAAETVNRLIVEHIRQAAEHGQR